MKSKNLFQNENWCIIYSDIEMTEETYEKEIMKIIAAYKQKTENNFEINKNVLIFKNPGYSELEKAVFPDGFMHFRFQISVEEINSYSVDDYIDFVSFLLCSLWNQKMPSVATCQFEELLPLKGGYKSKWSFSPPKDDLGGEINK